MTEFFYNHVDNVNNEMLLDSFIHSDHYRYDTLPNAVKANPSNKSYLRKAFDSNIIQAEDFKEYDKKGAQTFLVDFLTQFDWGDDKKEFEKLLDSFFQILNEITTNHFYIIDKAWFDKEDIRILQPENWVYIYYFLIIWIDNNSKILGLTEWTYD